MPRNPDVVYVGKLSLADFRSYSAVDLDLGPGVTALIGPNGQGKTNLVEAVCYLSTLSSHRVANDAPLVKSGADRAVIRARVTEHEGTSRPTSLEIEITPGRANRAQINRSPARRPRDILGVLRTVLFAPEDLSLIKGDPAGRRRFLDDLLVARAPRYAAVRSDYERVLKQRNALLKSAAQAMRSGRGRSGSAELPTLDVWDSHLANTGAELLVARLKLIDAIRPLVSKAYEAVATTTASSAPASSLTELTYKSSLSTDDALQPDQATMAESLLETIRSRRREEVERGVSLVGPHRDDVELRLGTLPAKGYASQGESWSYALALRLASFDLLRANGSDPVLILDDVFSELDSNRRARLAELVADAEQVLVTAAVPEDVPGVLSGSRLEVAGGTVQAA